LKSLIFPIEGLAQRRKEGSKTRGEESRDLRESLEAVQRYWTISQESNRPAPPEASSSRSSAGKAWLSRRALGMVT